MAEFTPQYSHLVALAFLGAGALSATGLIAAFLKPQLAKFSLAAAGLTGGGYLLALLALSLASTDKVLLPGQLKYFCEMDCHQAYTVLAVRREADRAVVTVRAWFDEKTISPQRGDAPLLFDDRRMELRDGQGRRYTPSPADLRRPLRPGEAFTVDLTFPAPSTARDLRLLIAAPDAFPTQLLLGHENSLLHKKIWFKLG
jgi:hypothetical protein